MLGADRTADDDACSVELDDDIERVVAHLDERQGSCSMIGSHAGVP